MSHSRDTSKQDSIHHTSINRAPIHASLAQAVFADNVSELLEQYPNMQIIDIREAEDYHASHIEGARNFPMSDFASLSNEIVPNQQTSYMLHCYSGHTVSVYGSYLVKMGAKNVYYFDESFEDLEQALQHKK